MLFREFNIIAAVAFAAECARTGNDEKWDDLSEEARASQVQNVMAIARGEGPQVSPVFTATVQAILGFNDGQGGLALERIANLGEFLLDTELITPETAQQGGDIVDHAKALLQPLAELKALGVGFFITPPSPEVVEASAELEDATVQ